MTISQWDDDNVDDDNDGDDDDNVDNDNDSNDNVTMLTMMTQKRPWQTLEMLELQLCCAGGFRGFK